MFFDDLDNLDNILDRIEPRAEVPQPKTQEDRVQLLESIIEVMKDYVNDNPNALIEEDFNDTFIDSVTELMMLQLGYDDENEEDDDMEEKKDLLEDIIEEAAEYFYDNFMPERSFEDTFVIEEFDKEEITKKIEYLRNKPQPDQRTQEWYEFRHNLITASNAYKAFEGESTRNQLIYEKCQPLKISENSLFVNINTPFHHGQKYEPLSVMVYENKYGVKVGDFGCIQHDKYSFLGASPDGINIDIASPTYGRMLEIKNIVNRVIDGIPKKEYWVQMQMQMETCDLDECDFLETKFVEYNDSDESTAYDKFICDGSFNTSSNNQLKGVMMYFAKEDGNPNYVYCPLNIKTLADFTKWEEAMLEMYQNKMTWIKNIYWKLEQLSCVLVLRNKEWFANSIKKLQEVWNIIEKERISGHEHRAPNKRVKKEMPKLDPVSSNGGCLLNFNKSEGKFLLVPEPQEKPSPKIEVIKIRTESIDETKTNF
jgi:putative phage-type endonuclease